MLMLCWTFMLLLLLQAGSLEVGENWSKGFIPKDNDADDRRLRFVVACCIEGKDLSFPSTVFEYTPFALVTLRGGDNTDGIMITKEGDGIKQVEEKFDFYC